MASKDKDIDTILKIMRPRSPDGEFSTTTYRRYGTGGFMIYDAMYEIPMELDVYRKLNMLGTSHRRTLREQVMLDSLWVHYDLLKIPSSAVIFSCFCIDLVSVSTRLKSHKHYWSFLFLSCLLILCCGIHLF